LRKKLFSIILKPSYCIYIFKYFSPKPAKKVRELSIVSLSSTNIPPKEVECYTKAVQTTHSSNERDGTVYFINFNFKLKIVYILKLIIS
jgi:hypothetical protein